MTDLEECQKKLADAYLEIGKLHTRLLTTEVSINQHLVASDRLVALLLKDRRQACSLLSQWVESFSTRAAGHWQGQTSLTDRTEEFLKCSQ